LQTPGLESGSVDRLNRHKDNIYPLLVSY
jgi:hypothetical protein